MSALPKYERSSKPNYLDLSAFYALHAVLESSEMFLSFKKGAEKGEDEGKKEEDEGKDKLQTAGLLGGRTPLHWLIIYFIRKNNPTMAIKLLRKALEKAKTPKQTMKVLNLAYTATVEMKQLGWFKDMAEVQNTILIAQVCSGSSMFKMPTERMLDYSLLIGNSTPRSRMTASKPAGGWQHKLSIAHTAYSYGDEARERTFNRLAHAADKKVENPFAFSGMSISHNADDYEAFKAAIESAAEANTGAPSHELDLARVRARGVDIANVLTTEGLDPDAPIIDALMDELVDCSFEQMELEPDLVLPYLKISNETFEEKKYLESASYDIGEAPMVVSYDASHEDKSVVEAPSSDAEIAGADVAETMLAVFGRAIEGGDIEEALDSIKDFMPKEQFKAVVEALHVLAGDEPSGPITTFSAVQRAQLGLRSSFTDSVSVKQKAMGVVLQALLAAHDKNGDAPRKAVDLSKLDIA